MPVTDTHGAAEAAPEANDPEFSTPSIRRPASDPMPSVEAVE